MRTTLVCRWWEKNNKPFVALLAAGAALAMATLIDASSSTQVEQFDPLVVPRTGHAATALADGRVLITGGRDGAGTIVAIAEIFDPATETSTAVGALVTARVSHTATLLPNGRVLVAGGTSATGPLSSAEIFDPANPGAALRVLSATMGAARAGHTATLLKDGTVLIAGGDVAGTAEIFDPTTETFSSTLLTMAAPRIGHTATLFSNDSVLLAGGNTDSMELFTPADQKFTLDSQVMSAVHTGQEAISLSDTRLFFFGGDALNTIEEFNPSADTLTVDGTMDAPASSTTLLANGKILVLRPDLAGLYEPDAVAPNPAFTAFDETSVPGTSILLRNGQTATELPGDKTILVAGGAGGQSQLSQSTAVFNPARIWTDKDDYVPTDPVVLSSSGWKANENVYLYAVDSQTEAWTYGSTVAADANGAFSVNPYFIVQMAQLGAKFSVTAVGAQSAMQADLEFTDAGNFTYSPSTQSLTIAAGSNASFNQSITDPKNNDALTASPVVTGTGGNPLPASWVSTTPSSLSFSASSSDQTSSWAVKVAVPANVAGIYTGNIKASATVVPPGTKTPGQGQGTDMTITVPAGPATKLALSGSTTNLTAGSTRVLTATIQDANGNTVFSGPDSTLSVTFAKTSGTGTVTGLGSSMAVAGVATLTVTGGQPGSVTITASATGSGGALAAGTGNPITFTVVAGAAAKLALSGATTDLASGSTRVLTATIQDAASNTVTTGADSTISITFAKTSGTGTVTGLGSSTAVAGVATVTVTGALAGSVTITASGTASTGALAAGTGNPITFNVVAGAAAKLALSGSTADLASGSTRQLTATVQDTGGNTVSTGADSTISITFAKTSGTGTVTGLGSSNAVAGVATLTVTGNLAGSVTITASGTASTGALAAGAGNPITFNVIAGAAAKLAFAQQPTDTAAGQTISVVTVQILDTSGNLTGSTANVSLALTGSPVGVTLSGTLTKAAVSGVATFNDLSINKGGVYTLSASSAGLTGATSASFTISNPAPTLASIAPTSGNLTQTLDVTFTGTNFISGVSSVSFGSDITVNSTVVNSQTAITANITIPANATVGVHNVSVTNATPGGGTATLNGAFTVNNPATTTTVGSTPNPSIYGNAVTFTATVTSVSGTPTGSVTFYDGGASCSTPGTALGAAATLNGSGIAGLSTSALTGGSHTVLACYTPTGIYNASSGSVVQQVNQATPTVSFTGAPASAYFNSQFTVSASTNASTTPTITASGACTISGTTVTMTSGVGTCSLLASWAADTNYVAATATQSTTALQVPVSVTVPDTTVTYDGTPKSVTPTVTPAVAYAVTYTGISPTVYATSSTAPTEPGSYTVVATVTDPNYTGSGSGTLTISKKDPALVLTLLTGMPEPSAYGTRAYFELTTATSPCPTA